MPRVQRHSLDASTDVSLLVFRISPSFLGGPDQADPYDGARLRQASNLLTRTCQRLGLCSEYAVTPARSPSPQVEVCFAASEDCQRMKDAAFAGISKSQVTHEMDNTIHDRLLKIAGPPNTGARDRRAIEKDRKREEGFSSHWTWAGPTTKDKDMKDM